MNRNSTTHIVGLSERENDVLLPFLLDHVRSPEYQCRFHWEEGSIAFWDNRVGAALRGGRLPRAAHHAPRHDRRTGRPLMRDAAEAWPDGRDAGAKSTMLIDYEARYLSEPGAVGLFTRLTRVGLLVDAFQHRCLDPFGLLFIDYSVLRVLRARRAAAPHVPHRARPRSCCGRAAA